MNRQQILFVLHAALLVGALFFIAPILAAWDMRAGFFFAMAFSWLFFCLPVIGWHALPSNDGQLFSERLPWRQWWLLPALVAQVGVVAITCFVPYTSILSSGGMWLALLIAAINAPLEELAWRGGFLATFSSRPKLGFWLGWALFSLSYVPIVLAFATVFEAMMVPIIAVFALLGWFWGWIAWRSGSVFYTALAHFLSDVFAFWILFDRQGWTHWAWQP